MFFPVNFPSAADSSPSAWPRCSSAPPRGFFATLCVPLFLCAQPLFGAYGGSAEPTVSGGNPFFESAVRKGASAAFIGDTEALQSLAIELRAYENKNAEGLRGFRLSDNFAALAAQLVADRSERLERLNLAAEEADPDVRAGLARQARDDPLLQALRMERRRVWNRMAGSFNYITQSTASLLNGNTQVLLKWTVDLLFSWRRLFDYTPWERKQRSLYREFIERYPTDPEIDSARSKLARLDLKHQERSAKERKLISELYLESGNPEEAIFHAEKARELGANSGKTELEANQALSRAFRNKARMSATASTGDSRLDTVESQAFERLLGLMVRGEAEGLERESKDFQATYPQSSLRNQALCLEALAAQLQGRGEDSQALYQAVADSKGGGAMAVHAGNLLASPEASHRAAYQAARAKRDAEVRRFIFLGFDPPSARLDQAYEGQAGRIVFVDYLAALFVIDSAIRAIKVGFGAGPPNDELRDAAARWSERDSASERGRELAGWLGGQAQRRGAFDLARAYYERAQADDPEQMAELRKKEARDTFLRASRIDDPGRRLNALQGIYAELSDTKYSQKAARAAAESEKELRITLSKRELELSPGLWNGRGLRWDPAWFDGRPENGEISSAGVTFFPPDYSVVEFEVAQDGTRESRRQRLDDRALRETSAALRERKMLAERLIAAEEYQKRLLVPLELKGSAGGSGLQIYPRLMPYQFDPGELPLYR